VFEGNEVDLTNTEYFLGVEGGDGLGLGCCAEIGFLIDDQDADEEIEILLCLLLGGVGLLLVVLLLKDRHL
jgi:hypothetical protein